GGETGVRDTAYPADGGDVVGMEGMGSDEAAFERAGGKPVAIGDDAVVAAMRNADGAGVLLRGVEAIGEAAVERDSVELPGWLVVPGAPDFAAIEGDDRALVGAHEDAIGVIGSDPEDVI